MNNEEVYEYWIDWATTYDPTNWTRLPKVLEEDPKPVKLNFDLLPPFSQISFRVAIFNRIGAGDPSVPTDPSNCITQPAGTFIAFHCYNPGKNYVDSKLYKLLYSYFHF